MVLLRFMACERHALLASPFVMFAPLMLRYGYEIRMYSLIPFLSVLGTYLLLRAMREDGMRPDRRRSGRGSTALRRIADRRWWIAYAIVVALGMYSQYMMAFVWMTHVLWLYVALRRHGHARRFPRMLIPYALAVALYIPWIPSAVGQFASSALPPLKETMNLSELTSVFSILTTGFDAKRLTSGMTVALLAMLAVLIAGSSRLRDTAGSTVRSGMEPSAARSVAAAEDRADSGRAARHLAFFAFVPLSLLLVFALMLALCGCSAKAKGVTLLPGGCEIERIGSGECVLSRRESERVSCILVEDYVYAYCVSDNGAYIGVKALPYELGLELEGELSALSGAELRDMTLYYRVSLHDGSVEGYRSEAQFDELDTGFSDWLSVEG